MNHNEIPFSPEPPKEPGAYWYKFNAQSSEFLVEISETKLHGLRIWGEPFPLGKHVSMLCETSLYSAKLIPSTALDEAKKRIEELQAALERFTNPKGHPKDCRCQNCL